MKYFCFGNTECSYGKGFKQSSLTRVSKNQCTIKYWLLGKKSNLNTLVWNVSSPRSIPSVIPCDIQISKLGDKFHISLWSMHSLALPKCKSFGVKKTQCADSYSNDETFRAGLGGRVTAIGLLSVSLPQERAMRPKGLLMDRHHLRMTHNNSSMFISQGCEKPLVTKIFNVKWTVLVQFMNALFWTELCT